MLDSKFLSKSSITFLLSNSKNIQIFYYIPTFKYFLLLLTYFQIIHLLLLSYFQNIRLAKIFQLLLLLSNIQNILFLDFEIFPTFFFPQNLNTNLDNKRSRVNIFKKLKTLFLIIFDPISESIVEISFFAHPEHV
jgi:hypothetical protein